MKSLNKMMWVFLGILTVSGMVACGKSSSTPPSVAVCPPGSGPVGDGSTCAPIGIVPGGIPAGTKIGFFSQSSNMSQTFNPAGSVYNQGPGYRNILKDAMGVCDRIDQVGGSSYGLAGCDAWLQGYHDITIQMDGSTANQVKMIIRSAPNVNPFYQYSASIPSFSQAIGCIVGFCYSNNSGINNPLVITMTVWNVNNNQGFELRPSTAGGPSNSYAWNKPMQFQVLNGKIEDPTLNFKLLIDDGHQNMATAISGTMVRCQTQNCGIQNF